MEDDIHAVHEWIINDNISYWVCTMEDSDGKPICDNEATYKCYDCGHGRCKDHESECLIKKTKPLGTRLSLIRD